MKSTKLKKGVLFCTVMAQMIVSISSVAAAENKTGDFSLVYDACSIPTADYPLDTAIEKNLVNSYGIHFNENPTGAIWSVQRKKDDYVTHESLRFSTQTTAGKPRDLNLMTLKFSDDTVNSPVELNGDGYTFESEFFALNRDTGYINLVFTGEDLSGESHDFAEIRLVPTNNSSVGRAGKAYAVDSSGNQIGSSKDIILTSLTSDTDPEEMYYIKADFDFVNQKYSAWLMVRSSSTVDYTETEPTVADMLVDNVDLNYRAIEKFTGFEFNITKSEYGNGVWLKKAEINDCKPTVRDDVLVSSYYTDTMAMDNSQYAVDNDLTNITNGDTEITYNDYLNMYESNINTDTNYAYSVKLPVLRRSQMITTDGFTLECYSKQTKFPNSSNVIFGAAQSGGFDIETNSSGKLSVYIRSTDNKWITDENGDIPEIILF